MRSVLTVSFLTALLIWGSYLILGDTITRVPFGQPQTTLEQEPSSDAGIQEIVRNIDEPTPEGSFADAMKKVVSKNNGITQFIADEPSDPVDLPKTKFNTPKK
jgi:hypothetical protein